MTHSSTHSSHAANRSATVDWHRASRDTAAPQSRFAWTRPLRRLTARRILAGGLIAGGLLVPAGGIATAGGVAASPLPLAGALLAQTAEATAPLIFTAKTRFRIPFEFDVDRLRDAGGQDVLLFVSRDGASWSRAGSCPLDRDFLEYAADSDGRYRFGLKVRTQDETLIPPGPVQPLLSVVVDRTLPTIAIGTGQSESGQPVISWMCDDADLNLAALAIETSRDGLTWTPVPIEPTRRGQVSPNLSDGLPSGGFAVGGGAGAAPGGTLLVRARVADKAGNVGQAEARMTLGEQTAAPTIQPSRRSSARLAGPGFSRSIREVNPLTDASEAADLASLDASDASGSGTGGSPLMRPGRGGDGGAVRSVSLPSRSEATAAGPAMPERSPEPFGQPEPYAASLPAFTQAAAPSPYTGAADQSVRVNSHRFAIEYALQQVGHSGVRQVDAYITEDDGRNWFHYGPDADAESPIEIEVPREGRYGFAFRAQNGAGIAIDPPQPGDVPDVRVEVDATPPQVRLTAVEPIGGQSSGEIRIGWTATDRELAERPVTLEWATDAAGPWTTIAERLPNDGQFLWEVEPSIPPAVLVRVRVADSCGNVGESATPQPVVVDFSRPSIRVLHVTPQ